MRQIYYPVKRQSGSGAGTATLPYGASVLQLQAHGNGTVQIFNDPNVITVVTAASTYFSYTPADLYLTASQAPPGQTPGSNGVWNQITFGSGIDSWFVEYTVPQGS